MSKRFKFKLPRVVFSSLQICRSRNLHDTPLPKGGCRKAVEIGFPEPPPSTPREEEEEEEDSFVSVKVIRSIDRLRRDHEEDAGLDSIEYSWQEDGRWHVVDKRVDHRRDDEEVEPVVVGRYEKSQKDGAMIGKRNASSSSVSMRLSSSRRFWKEDEDESGEAASVSVLKRTASMESAGKVRDSVAVVKRSENPLEDFRTSMIEMVVERRMFEAGDLERLLRCFLSLNSREYHGIIVEAFSELWQMMFADDDEEFTK